MTQPATSPATPLCVLVVGATGFLGAKIVAALRGRPGVMIRALSRKGAPADAAPGVEWVRGDMMEPASLDRALAGVDVVISSANGYMKESIAVDFEGNRNLVQAVARAGVKRFVFLSIVACEQAADVPHFHAKTLAEDLIRTAGVPHVFVRAPAFLDQSDDYIAKAVKGGKFYAVGDRHTRWSYVLTDDLAENLAAAAVWPGDAILGQTIDIGWRDGPKSQQEIADIIAELTGRRLTIRVVPWTVFRVLVRPVRLISELGYDLMRMFLFFRRGVFVADGSAQERFFAPAPTAHDAIARWARANSLI